jgi:Sulfotransferase domain
MNGPVRIAMWSGPRNISTAMMRSWGSRSDCAVIDEPMYAHYLSTLEPSRRDKHPGVSDVLGSQSSDWHEVSSMLTGPIPDGRPIWYQKQMAHHLSSEMELDWVGELTNCFLIREPAAMITSLIKIIDSPIPEDLGLPQQVRLFERVKEMTGQVPTVIDSRDILRDPRLGLSSLCNQLGVPFDEAMLAWAPGGRPEDGIWAPHWYASVYQSTGFAPYRSKDEEVPASLRGVLDECNALYETLAQHTICVES